MRDVTRSTWDHLTNSPADPGAVAGFSLNPFEYLAKGAQGAISAIAEQGSGDLSKLKRESDRQFQRAQGELGKLRTEVARMKGEREGERRAAQQFVKPAPVAAPKDDRAPLFIAAGAVGAAALLGLVLALRR